MGTRGLMSFAYDGELKGMYNHFDSYPSYLGAHIVKWITEQQGDFERAREQVKALTAVDEDSEPTEDQILALLKNYNPNVSTGSPKEWYALLRDTQGNPQATLDAVFYVDGLSFASDSLFCEWGYVIDLDNKKLEVYRGFQTEPHSEGRFAGAEVLKDYTISNQYYPIKLVREFTFEELVEWPELIEILENDEED